MYLIIVGCLVVNIIFYLLACSMSFYEAFLFGLSFVVRKSIQKATLIFLFLCDICFKLLASREAFYLSPSPDCCDFGCKLVRVVWPCISGIRVGVPECVDRSLNMRQFAPGPWVGQSCQEVLVCVDRSPTVRQFARGSCFARDFSFADLSMERRKKKLTFVIGWILRIPQLEKIRARNQEAL